MPISRLMKKLSHPTVVPPAAKDTGGVPSTDKLNGHRQSSEPTRTITRLRRRKRTFTDHSSMSRQSSAPPLTRKAEYPLAQGGMREILLDKPLPPEPSVLLTQFSMVSSPDMVPVTNSPVQDKLAEAWDAVKDDSDARVVKMRKGPHNAGMCSLSRVLFRVNFVLAFR